MNPTYETRKNRILSRRWWRPLWKRIVDLRGRKALWFLGACAVLFFAISFLIHNEEVQETDLAVTRWMQEHRTPLTDVVARSFTFLGNTGTLVFIGAVGAFVFWRAKRPLAALLFALCVMGVPLNYAMKGVFNRPRPGADLVEVLGPTFGLSFPSGHAMASTMVFGFLALMTWLHAPRKRLRILGTVGFACTAISISVSRVYLGAHWLSDVLGGWTSGLFFLLIFAEIYRIKNKVPFAPGKE